MNWQAWTSDEWAETAPGIGELNGIRQVLESAPGGALDAACGSGAVLLPLLAAGLDVEGADCSEERLELCRLRAAELGLRPRLYPQAMHRLDPGKPYGAIYVARGGFRSIADLENAREALRCFRRLLKPEGALALSVPSPFGPGQALSGERSGEWQLTERRSVFADSAEVRAYVRTEALDPMRQVLLEQRRYALWDGEALVESGTRTVSERWYFRHQLEEMLGAAGFSHVRLDESAGPENWLFVAS